MDMGDGSNGLARVGWTKTVIGTGELLAVEGLNMYGSPVPMGCSLLMSLSNCIDV